MIEKIRMRTDRLHGTGVEHLVIAAPETICLAEKLNEVIDRLNELEVGDEHTSQLIAK